ncbi:MAG TPA: hypothetical protein VIM53_04360 [Candidatus Saccharimonadales bacterium]
MGNENGLGMHEQMTNKEITGVLADKVTQHARWAGVERRIDDDPNAAPRTQEQGADIMNNGVDVYGTQVHAEGGRQEVMDELHDRALGAAAAEGVHITVPEALTPPPEQHQ